MRLEVEYGQGHNRAAVGPIVIHIIEVLSNTCQQ